MTLTIPTIRVTGTFVSSTGLPARRFAKFTPSYNVLRDTTGRVIASPTAIQVTPDAAGHIAVDLTATNYPGVDPANFVWHVEEPTGRSYNLSLDYATAGGTLDLVDIVSATSGATGQTTVIARRIRDSIDYDNAVAPTDGQSIIWDAGTGHFKPGAGGGGTSGFAGYAIIDQSLSDVTGATDATAAFVTAYATGKPVYVPPGTYTVTNLAPPTLSQTIGAGHNQSLIRYTGTGIMCTLTNHQLTKFVDLRFTVTNAAATLFKVDNTFRASWTRCRFQGSHTAVGDAYATTSGHIGVWLTGNSGDNLFYDCDFLNLGIGLKTDCIQNAMIGGKFGSCYNGIYGFGGGGMALSGYVDFVGPFTPAIIVDKAINIDGATGQWWLSDVWIEGCTTGISVGTGSTGPTQFSLTNSKVASTTTCIAMNACRNPTIFGVQLAGDGGGVGTPDPFVVDATNAPEGVIFAESLITGKPVDTHLLPLGWSATARVPGGTSTAKAPNELQFSFGSFLKMARSDGSLAPVLWVVGGPQLKIGAPGSNGTAVVRFQDTTPSVMLEMDSVLSSVNYPVIVPAVTGSAPALISRGTDTNIDFGLTPKGTGAVVAGGSGLALPGFATGSLPTASAHAKTLAWDNTLSKPTYSDGSTWTAVGTGSGGSAAPAPLSGQYFHPISSGSTAANSMPVGSMFAVPWDLGTGVTLTRIGGEVSTVGDSGSKIRLGIYADNGSYYPGSLVLDAGQIAGDSATVQELTISQALTAGTYWLVAVGQSITTVAPTMRHASGFTPRLPLGIGTALPAANALWSSYVNGSVTAALPSTFTATVTANSRAPRLILKAA